MNAGKICCFVVAVLVSAPLSGCATMTAGTPTGGSAQGSGGIIPTDSTPPYKPAQIRETFHSGGERVGGRISMRFQRN
jgi:hypothetical protein